MASFSFWFFHFPQCLQMVKGLLNVPYVFTAQKMETADLVAFTEEIINGKLKSLCSVFVLKSPLKQIFGKELPNVEKHTLLRSLGLPQFHQVC